MVYSLINDYPMIIKSYNPPRSITNTIVIWLLYNSTVRLSVYCRVDLLYIVFEFRLSVDCMTLWGILFVGRLSRRSILNIATAIVIFLQPVFQIQSNRSYNIGSKPSHDSRDRREPNFFKKQEKNETLWAVLGII